MAVTECFLNEGCMPKSTIPVWPQTLRPLAVPSVISQKSSLTPTIHSSHYPCWNHVTHWNEVGNGAHSQSFVMLLCRWSQIWTWKSNSFPIQVHILFGVPSFLSNHTRAKLNIKVTFKALGTYLLIFLHCAFPCFLSQARSPHPLPLSPKVSHHSKSIKMAPLRRRAWPPPQNNPPSLCPFMLDMLCMPSIQHTLPFSQLWKLLEDKRETHPVRC